MATSNLPGSTRPRRHHRLVGRYGLAVVLTVLAVAVRLALTPLWGREVPLIMFYPAIMASAWFGGFGPGLTTTLLSAVSADYFIMEPGLRFRLDVGTIVALGMFVGTGGFMSVVIEALHRAQDRLIALFKRERAARAEADRVARTLQQLQLVAELPLPEVSIDALMRESLAYARAALASDTATILLLTDDGAHLIPVSSDGLREDFREDIRIPLGQGIAGRIAVSASGMIFDDLTKEEVVSAFLRDRVQSLVGAPLRVGDRLIGVVHVDSTAPRRFTEEDLTLLRLVAQRVALLVERTRLYTVEQEARRAAEGANRMKDDFLAMLSHELRSPLNAIAGWTNMLKRKADPEVRRSVEVIGRNTQLLATLVDDLLDASRIVAGQLEIGRQRVEVTPLVNAVLDTMRPAAEKNGVTLHGVLDAASGVWGDPVRLHQAVANLVGNAIKFTPAGGSVEVRVQGGESEATIIVSDTGHGISPEFLPHVFDRFRQEDTSPTRTHGGLGLGLTIVRHLVEAHAGTVRAESPGRGRGARFTVRLPVTKAEAGSSSSAP